MNLVIDPQNPIVLQIRAQAIAAQPPDEARPVSVTLAPTNWYPLMTETGIHYGGVIGIQADAPAGRFLISCRLGDADALEVGETV